jgi:hypothetical protein
MSRTAGQGSHDRDQPSAWVARSHALLEQAEAAATAYLVAVAAGAAPDGLDAPRRAWHEASATLIAAATELVHRPH